RCRRLGPLHQRHPGRSRSLVRHHDCFHLDTSLSLCISPPYTTSSVHQYQRRETSASYHAGPPDPEPCRSPAGCSHGLHRPLWPGSEFVAEPRPFPSIQRPMLLNDKPSTSASAIGPSLTCTPNSPVAPCPPLPCAERGQTLRGGLRRKERLGSGTDDHEVPIR